MARKPKLRSKPRRSPAQLKVANARLARHMDALPYGLTPEEYDRELELARFNSRSQLARHVNKQRHNLGPQAFHAFLGRGLRNQLETLCWYHGIVMEDEFVQQILLLLTEMEEGLK